MGQPTKETDTEVTPRNGICWREISLHDLSGNAGKPRLMEAALNMLSGTWDLAQALPLTWMRPSQSPRVQRGDLYQRRQRLSTAVPAQVSFVPVINFFFKYWFEGSTESWTIWELFLKLKLSITEILSGVKKIIYCNTLSGDVTMLTNYCACLCSAVNMWVVSKLISIKGRPCDVHFPL